MGVGWRLSEKLIEGVGSGVISLLIPFLLSYVPQLHPYLSVRVAIPLWAILSIALGLLALAVVALRHARRIAAKAFPVPSFHPFSCLGFCWEISSEFLEVFRATETPIPDTLDDLIKGPYCPKCGRPLRHAEWESRVIENPCLHCGRTHPGPLGDIAFHQLKGEIYREAQRQARLGRFPSKNDPCHAIPVQT